jgi:RNA polymerase sigma-70 factor, ECF subfamily
MEHFDDKALSNAASVGGALSTARLAGPLVMGDALEILTPSFDRSSDESLMALVATGDRDAFSLLYERHARASMALATQMCSRRVIAEEVVQEAFLSVWRGRRNFDPSRGSLRGWVLGIVRNRAIDVLRQNVAQVAVDSNDRVVQDLLEAPDRTDHEVGRLERARELRLALGGLPPEQSRVIALAYYGGYTHTEIATMLDTPIGTVKGRLRLGLRKMAGRMPAPI